MSNGFKVVIYFVLVLLEFLLKIVNYLFKSVIIILNFIYSIVFDVITMSNTTKKRKRTEHSNYNQTIVNRHLIGSNWQKLLSSNLIMDKKTEETNQDKKTNHFTGTFRRARKKRANDDITSKTVQSDLKTLNISSDSLNNTSKDAKVDNPSISVSNKGDNNRNRITKFIAMDCEMVGIGYDGNDHMLARVSIVNKFGDCIYDKFVKAREEVKDYRTDVSGIRREDMLNGEDFTVVQKEVADILKGKILVGHSLKNDLSVLFLSHPKRSIRDTAKYKPFKKITRGSTPSLKRLAKEILGIDIQHGEHSSVEDARAVMQLYCTVAKKWEAGLSEKRGHMHTRDE